MAKNNPRVHRIADLIQKEVSDIIRHEIKDHELATLIVTVTSVDVNRDLSQAKIYVSEMTEQHELMVDVLNKAAGFIRRALAPRLLLRHVPSVSFHYDDSMEKGRKISELLKKS